MKSFCLRANEIDGTSTDGAIVAYFIMNTGGGGHWSMFLFGGFSVFLITQLHGLGLTKRQRWLIALPLLAAMIVFYAFVPEQIPGVPRQLLIRYAGVFLTFGLLWLILRPLNLLPDNRDKAAAAGQT